MHVINGLQIHRPSVLKQWCAALYFVRKVALLL